MNKQFEEWYKNNMGIFAPSIGRFKVMDFSLKWGVYLDFFDTVGIIIEVEPNVSGAQIFIWLFDKENNCFEKIHSQGVEGVRTEAQKEAVKKAFEILENK